FSQLVLPRILYKNRVSFFVISRTFRARFPHLGRAPNAEVQTQTGRRGTYGLYCPLVATGRRCPLCYRESTKVARTRTSGTGAYLSRHQPATRRLRQGGRTQG